MRERSRRARLVRCTELWGTADTLPGEPASQRLDETLYLPCVETGLWGLFAGGRCLTEHGGKPSASDGAADGTVAEASADGPFLYIGALAPHYGYFLINTLPRLWPLTEPEGLPPGLRLLCHHPEPQGWRGLDFIGAILARLGVAVEDVVTFARPTRIRDVLVPEPSLREQAGMHAAFARLCRAIGSGLHDPASVDGIARPVYLSKTRLPAGIAHIVNEAEVAAALERRGVEIASPETLPFAAQVRLLSERRIVMGSVGSAFHTCAFAAPGRRLTGLNWQPLLNANFALLDRVNGARARYYFPHGTRYGDEPGWGVSWRLADPEGVAAALLRRAEWLDRDEADDEGWRAELFRRAARPLRGVRALARPGPSRARPE